jgi:hypothetical protein
VRIDGGEALAQRRGVGAPAVAHDRSRRAAFVAHHGVGAVVDRRAVRGVHRAARDVLGEPTVEARDGEAVGLREVEHDVRDGPALTGRGSRPLLVVEIGDQRIELRVLLGQCRELAVHEARR